MFTDCPSCERLFRIRADQLMAADGWVRCGNCEQMFYALERLHDAPIKHPPTLPRSDEVAPVAPVVNVAPASAGAESLNPDLPAPEPATISAEAAPEPMLEPAAQGEPAEPVPVLPGTATIGAEAAPEPMLDPAAQGEPAEPVPVLPGTATIGAEATPEPMLDPAAQGEPAEPVPVLPGTATIGAEAAPEPMLDPAAQDEPAEPVPVLPGTATIGAEATPEPMLDPAAQDEPAEPVQALSEPERPAAQDIETAQAAEPAQPPDEALRPRPDIVRPEPAEPETDDAPQSRDDLPEPPPILVNENKKRAGPDARLIWGSLVVILALVAIAQLSWLNRDDLTRRYPALAVWVETICESLQCEPIRFRDISAIELLSGQVSQHPRYRNALLASATMVNNAKFVQPYPEIELLIFATDGQIIARGYFKPDEYLAPGIRPVSGMSPGAPVHFGLDLAGIVAPQARSFRFRFH